MKFILRQEYKEIVLELKIIFSDEKSLIKLYS